MSDSEADFSDEDYLNYDPFFGEEADIKCQTIKLVKVRKEHDCYLGRTPGGKPHSIKIGDRARYEKALVDGDTWGSYYMCLPCLARDIAQYEGADDV